MTPKERLLLALEGKKTDRPPFICPGGMMNMAVTEIMNRGGHGWPAAHTDPAIMAALTRDVVGLGKIENYGVPFCLTIEAEALGAGVDLGGPDVEPHVTDYLEENIEDLALPVIDTSRGRAAVVVQAIENLETEGDGLPIIGNLSGPFSVITSLVNPLIFLRQIKRQPEATHSALERITDSSVAFGLAQAEAGADLIVISDPSATGEILGPVLFGQMALPYLNRISEELHARGVPTIVHICGRVQNLSDQLDTLAAKALSVDSVVGLSWLRRRLPHRVLMGNVSTQLLEWGPRQKITTAGRFCIKNGVDILAPACGIGLGTSIENLRALASAVNGDGYAG